MARGLGLCPKGQGSRGRAGSRAGSGEMKHEMLALTPERQDPGRRAVASGVPVEGS